MKKLLIAMVSVIALAWLGFCVYFEASSDWKENQRVTDYHDSLSYVDDFSRVWKL